MSSVSESKEALTTRIRSDSKGPCAAHAAKLVGLIYATKETSAGNADTVPTSLATNVSQNSSYYTHSIVLSASDLPLYIHIHSLQSSEYEKSEVASPDRASHKGRLAGVYSMAWEMG